MKLHELATRMASGMGSTGLGQELRMRLENASMPGVSLEQRFEMGKEVQSLMPGADKEKILGVLRTAGESNKAGKDPAIMARTMARLSRVFKKASADELRDKANVYLEQSGGAELTEEGANVAMRFEATGAGTADQGLAEGLAAIMSGGSAQTVGKRIDQLAKMKVEKLKGHHTPAEREAHKLKNELAALPMAERYKLANGDRGLSADLFGDETAGEMFGNSKIAVAQQFHPDQIAAALANSGGSFRQSQKAQTQGDREYTKDLASQQMAENARIQKLRNKGPQRDFDDILTFLRGRGDVPAVVDVVEAEIKAGTYLGGDPVGLLRRVGGANLAIDFEQSHQHAMDEIQGTGVWAPPPPSDKAEAQRHREHMSLMGEHGEALNGVQAIMQAQLGMMQRMSLPGGTALRSNNPGNR